MAALCGALASAVGVCANAGGAPGPDAFGAASDGAPVRRGARVEAEGEPDVVAGGVFCAAVSSARVEGRSNNQPTMIILMTSRTAMATVHMGKRAFGGATLTSNRAGPLCRWLS